MPKVSVVIPAFNAAPYLDAAVGSVLAQTFRDVEILVIDDGSTDDTPAVMGRYGSPVRYVRQVNSGVSVARNRGLELAQGRYVAFLDGDDTWAPRKLERQMPLLDGSHGTKASYTAFIISGDDLRPAGVRRSGRRSHVLEDLLTLGNVVGTPSSVACDRSLFDEVGGFDPALSQCADWDMWIRLGTVTDFLYIDEPLVTYRQHGSNMSRNPELLERDSLLVLEKGLALPQVPERVRARRRQAFGRNYMVLAGTYFVAGHLRGFLRCVLRSLALDPRQAAYLVEFPFRRAKRTLTRANASGANTG